LVAGDAGFIGLRRTGTHFNTYDERMRINDGVAAPNFMMQATH
jgi:hypothetical protein